MRSRGRVTSRAADRFCAEAGRDPGAVVRSLVVPVSYDRPGDARDTIRRAVDAGFGHLVLMLPAPYPDVVARRVVDEVVAAGGAQSCRRLISIV